MIIEFNISLVIAEEKDLKNTEEKAQSFFLSAIKANN